MFAKKHISVEKATMIIKKLENSRFKKSIHMTVEDAMKLSPISRSPEGGYEVYAFQFGDVTLLFWFANSSCYMKEVCW